MTSYMPNLPIASDTYYQEEYIIDYARPLPFTTRTFADHKVGLNIDMEVSSFTKMDGLTSSTKTSDVSWSADTSWGNITGTKYADIIKGAGWGETINAGAGNDTIMGSAGADVLDGGTGTDTVDYSASVSFEGTPIYETFAPMDHYPDLGVNVNLASGQGSWGDANGDTYTNIENVTGSARDDVIVGNNAANVLKGGAGYDMLSGGAGNDKLDGGTGNDQLNGGKGADQLIGGAGSDTAVYSDSSAAVNINLKTGFGIGGDATGDRLTSIENVTGSNFNDTLSGDNNANLLDGGNGNDMFNGGLGADTFNGGSGIDTVTYANSSAGVEVTLEPYSYQGGAAPNEWLLADMQKGYVSGHGGEAEGDQLNGIEKVVGSNFNDKLTGDYNANTLEGGKGEDYLDAKGGNDVLSGGAGNDTFIISFGSGSDVITDFQAGARSGDKIVFEQVDDGSRPIMTYQDFMAHSTQVGKNLVFDFGNDHLTLNNVMKSQMTSDDFAVVVSQPIEMYPVCGEPPCDISYEVPVMAYAQPMLG